MTATEDNKMAFEIDETERGNILLLNYEEGWMNSWIRLGEKDQWLQISLRQCNYPALHVSTIHSTDEELAAHINKEFNSGCWTANKMCIEGVEVDEENCVIGDPDDDE